MDALKSYYIIAGFVVQAPRRRPVVQDRRSPSETDIHHLQCCFTNRVDRGTPLRSFSRRRDRGMHGKGGESRTPLERRILRRWCRTTSLYWARMAARWSPLVRNATKVSRRCERLHRPFHSRRRSCLVIRNPKTSSKPPLRGICEQAVMESTFLRTLHARRCSRDA